jgi:hypothetical protein
MPRSDCVAIGPLTDMNAEIRGNDSVSDRVKNGPVLPALRSLGAPRSWASSGRPNRSRLVEINGGVGCISPAALVHAHDGVTRPVFCGMISSARSGAAGSVRTHTSIQKSLTVDAGASLVEVAAAMQRPLPWIAG